MSNTSDFLNNIRAKPCRIITLIAELPIDVFHNIYPNTSRSLNEYFSTRFFYGITTCLSIWTFNNLRDSSTSIAFPIIGNVMSLVASACVWGLLSKPISNMHNRNLSDVKLATSLAFFMGPIINYFAYNSINSWAPYLANNIGNLTGMPAPVKLCQLLMSVAMLEVINDTLFVSRYLINEAIIRNPFKAITEDSTKNARHH